MEFVDRPLEAFGEMILEMSIPSQLSFKTPLVFRMIKELKKHGCLPPTGSVQAELALEEAITNAIVHGNKMDPARKVRISLFADQERWGAIIEDEGDGFTPEEVPQVLGLESLLREAGRGIMLMDSYVDQLLYNAAGNKVLLVRHREAEAPQQAAVPAAPAEPAGEAITSAREGAAIIVTIWADRLHSEGVGAMRTALTQAAADSRAVVLEMGRVQYISSVFLGVLVTAYKLVSSRGGILILTGVQAQVRDILAASKLESFFKFLPDRAQALAAVTERFGDSD